MLLRHWMHVLQIFSLIVVIESKDSHVGSFGDYKVATTSFLSLPCMFTLFPHSDRCWLNFVFIVCSPSLCNRLHLGSWHHIIQAWTFVWIALIKPSNENKALPVLFQLSLIFLLFFFFPLFFWCSALWTLFFPLSIFLAFAIPSPTHACHRRSGGSSLISGAAKNRGRTREAERESLCCFNGEEIVSWNVCGSTACLANWSHASLCLNSEYQRLDLPHHCDFPPVEKGGAYTCPRFCCCSGWFFLFFKNIWQPLRQETRRYSDSVMSKCHPLMLSVL